MSSIPGQILVVEDDEAIIQILKCFFEREGISAVFIQDGEKALEEVITLKPEMIILDIILPKLDGFTFLKALRKKGIMTPVIMLTSKMEISDKILGFELGADDYITKPFDPRELIARIKAVWRRRHKENNARLIKIGDFSLDGARREAKFKNNLLHFTKTEFDILYFLLSHKEEVVMRKDLMCHVLGYGPEATSNTLIMHISNIRRKLKKAHVNIFSINAVPGVGYILSVINRKKNNTSP